MIRAILIILCFPLVLFPFSLYAQFDKIGLDLPISYSFNEANDGERLESDRFPYGFMITVNYTENVYLGLDHYAIELKNDDNSRVHYVFFDGLYNIPLDFLNLLIGAGAGYAEIAGANADEYYRSYGYQLIIDAGFPIGDTFELSAGLHYIFAKIEYENNTDLLLEAGGFLYTLGVSMNL